MVEAIRTPYTLSCKQGLLLEAWFSTCLPLVGQVLPQRLAGQAALHSLRPAVESSTHEHELVLGWSTRLLMPLLLWYLQLIAGSILGFTKWEALRRLVVACGRCEV